LREKDVNLLLTRASSKDGREKVLYEEMARKS
jgi:hypothetical protein